MWQKLRVRCTIQAQSYPQGTNAPEKEKKMIWIAGRELEVKALCTSLAGGQIAIVITGELLPVRVLAFVLAVLLVYAVFEDKLAPHLKRVGDSLARKRHEGFSQSFLESQDPNWEPEDE